MAGRMLPQGQRLGGSSMSIMMSSLRLSLSLSLSRLTGTLSGSKSGSTEASHGRMARLGWSWPACAGKRDQDAAV
eukprot:928627-Rhodomonas_salina.1